MISADSDLTIAQVIILFIYQNDKNMLFNRIWKRTKRSYNNQETNIKVQTFGR